MELANLIEAFLAKNEFSLQPRPENTKAIAAFCDSIYKACKVKPQTRRSIRNCLTYVLPETIKTQEDAELVFPLVYKLVNQNHLTSSEREGFAAQSQQFVALNKSFDGTALHKYARSVFHNTIEETRISEEVAQKAKEVKQKNKVTVAYSDIARNIERGIVSENLYETLIACLTSSGCRMIEILRIATFEDLGNGYIKQTGVAKMTDGQLFVIKKPLLETTFDLFDAAVKRIRKDLEPFFYLTNSDLSKRYSKDAGYVVRELYVDTLKWDRTGTHFCRGLYAQAAYMKYHGPSSEYGLEPFVKEILGHAFSLDNYNLTVVLPEQSKKREREDDDYTQLWQEIHNLNARNNETQMKLKAQETSAVDLQTKLEAWENAANVFQTQICALWNVVGVTGNFRDDIDYLHRHVAYMAHLLYPPSK